VPVPGSGKPSERPVAGPVIPLALVPSSSDDQLAGGNSRPQGDPLVQQVLVKGEPVNPQPGRADDFSWPTGAAPAAAPANANSKSAPASPAPRPSSEAQPAAPQPSASVQPTAPAEQNTQASVLTGEPAPQNAPAKPKPQRVESKSKPASSDAPRPPRDVQQQRSGLSSGPFGLFR